jgi:hypothetical protein
MLFKPNIVTNATVTLWLMIMSCDYGNSSKKQLHCSRPVNPVLHFVSMFGNWKEESSSSKLTSQTCNLFAMFEGVDCDGFETPEDSRVRLYGWRSIQWP